MSHVARNVSPASRPTSTPSGRSILRREAIGFVLIIAAIWAAELFYLPHRLYGEAAEVSWLRLVLRTALVLVIWFWVHITTRRLLRRLHELEGFLRVCGWCRKVGDEDRWVEMETYFSARLATETSHGICPDCVSRQYDVLNTLPGKPRA